MKRGTILELRQLRYFVALADTLNFSRASESLFISQSGLSQQIVELEREMGVELFNRTKRSVELTLAGKALLKEAKELLIQSEKLIPIVRHAISEHIANRDIFIGVEARAIADPEFRMQFTDIIYKVRTELPGLRALFRELSPQEMEKALESQDIDIGVLMHHSPNLSENIDFRVLDQEEMLLVFRSIKEHNDNLDTVNRIISQRGLILLEREYRGMSQIFRILFELGIEPDIRFCDNRTAMILTLESGESAAILPKSVVTEINNPHLKYLHLNNDSSKLFLFAAWHRNNENELIKKIVHYLEVALK
jgi:DNA-binding transcriptional LysR family regulator